MTAASGHDLATAYATHYRDVLAPLATRLQAQLSNLFSGLGRIDRISARAKSVDRFLAKAAKMEGAVPRYSDPMTQIQDQIGARIVTFYRSDVGRVCKDIEEYFRPAEAQVIVPDTDEEFSYFGHHYITMLPTEIYQDIDRSTAPKFFELQVKTLFQHAWAEANHDLAYKPMGTPLSSDQKRKVAFTAAQAWGADMIFDELFQELAPAS